jgi:hypothetical protein
LERTNGFVKVTVLTLLKDRKIRKIEFLDVSVVCAARHLVKECGVLASPNPKPERSLDPEVAYTIEKFCCNDRVSRVM